MSSRFQAVFADVRPTTAAEPGQPVGKNRTFLPEEPILDSKLHERWYKRKTSASEATDLLNATFSLFRYIRNRVVGDSSSHREEIPLTRDRFFDRMPDYATGFSDDLNTLLVDSLPRKKLQAVISTVILETGKRMMGLSGNYFVKQLGDTSGEDLIPHDPELAKVYLRKFTLQLERYGLGRLLAATAYAVAASELVVIFTSYHFLNLNDCAARYKHLAATGLNPARELPISIQKTFYPFLCEFMFPTSDNLQAPNYHDEDYNHPSRGTGYPPSENLLNHIQVWTKVALDALCRFRMENAYSIIAGEDGVAKTLGLLDIKDFCSKDGCARDQIATRLTEDIRSNLLQPGTSSVKILDTYMLIIKTLTSKLPDGSQIDPTNVLLSHSAFAIREFLKERDDAPKIVISSLLEPQAGHTNDSVQQAPTSHENFSGQVSLAMSLHSGNESISRTFEGADLLDKNWLPTAESVEIYAQSRSKNSVLLTSPSALRHIITFAPPDVFVEQLERILAERLLRSDQLDFNVEMKLLKILQADFGDALIQSCENMLHDMMESARWNEKIRWSRDPASEHLHDTGFKAKILSHSSWQTLQWEKATKLPEAMESQLRMYEGLFDNIQDDRRLDWIKELGRVTVEIDLEDRTISEEVTPLQAAVIYHFTDSESPDNAEPLQVKASAIEHALEADEGAIRAALQFWVSKVVLKPSASDPDAFSVVERLPSAEDDAAAVAAAAAVAVQASEPDTSAMPTQADLLAQHSDMYTAYIVGMLTNMGAMEVQRIHSMLTMLAPGGFAFEVDELVDFLNDMNSEGKIERAGALWRIVQS